MTVLGTQESLELVGSHRGPNQDEAAAAAFLARYGGRTLDAYAPQASFGGQELYPDFVDKAAVLAVRISKNHPLLDGNKRLSWGCLVMFVVLNGRQLEVPPDDAVNTMLAVAAGEIDEAELSGWLAKRIRTS